MIELCHKRAIFIGDLCLRALAVLTVYLVLFCFVLFIIFSHSPLAVRFCSVLVVGRGVRVYFCSRFYLSFYCICGAYTNLISNKIESKLLYSFCNHKSILVGPSVALTN